MKTFKQIKEEIANVSSGYGIRGFGDVSGTPKVGDETEDNPHIERVVQGAREHSELVKQFVQGAYKDFDNVKHNHKHKKSIIQEEIGGVAGAAGSSSGSGYVAGVGSPLEGKPSNWGEPGVQPKDQGKKKKKDDPRMFGDFFRRAQPKEVGTAMKEIPIQEEIKTGMFASEQTFIVPSHVYERAMNEKRKGKHWRTYINDEMFHPTIREYANKRPHKPIIFEDEKTGYMCYARYGRKKN